MGIWSDSPFIDAMAAIHAPSYSAHRLELGRAVLLAFDEMAGSGRLTGDPEGIEASDTYPMSDTSPIDVAQETAFRR